MTARALWRSHLIMLAATIAALLILFHRDVADIVTIWWTSSTFTHCLFILPIVGWLIWQRRQEVAALPPRGWPLGLALIGAAGLLWVVGEAGGIALFRHIALVLMIQASVLILLGPLVTRGLLFPLFYLSFMVPFGDELVPPLQTITAKLSMFLLGLAGIPAHIEGVFISIPTGLFEVAESCSGIKFLVAMMAYGTLAANVCFKSWSRRIAFMTLAVIIPILANGVRAFGTIYISHLTTNEFAASFDHVVYGWFFFAAVTALVMGISWKYFDRSISDPWIDDVKAGNARAAKPVAALAIAIAMIACIPIVWQMTIATSGRIAMPVKAALPDVKGWKQVDIVQSHPWWPRFDGADHKLMAQYQNAAGQRVDLAVALFAWQEEKRELVGYGQGAFDPSTRWSWTNDTQTPKNGRAARIFAPGTAREVMSFYVLGGMTTGSSRIVKLETLKNRLLGRDQSAVAVLISSEDRPDRPSRPAIDGFLRDLGSVDRLAGDIITISRGQPQ